MHSAPLCTTRLTTANAPPLTLSHVSSYFISSKQEVREGLRRRGIAVSQTQLERVFHELDGNGDLRISRSEFEGFCARRRFEIESVFQQFDRDRDGRVSSDELRKGVEKAGLKISDDQLRVAFECLDENGDGGLSFAEFEKVLTLLPRGCVCVGAFPNQAAQRLPPLFERTGH